MDITAYQEAIRKDQTIDFAMGKKKTMWIPICYIGLVICSGWMIFFSNRGIMGVLVGICGLLSTIPFGLLTKRFLSKDLPKILSVNKEVLTIYDGTTTTLLGKTNSFVLIPWHEIIDLDMETVEVRTSRFLIPY